MTTPETAIPHAAPPFNGIGMLGRRLDSIEDLLVKLLEAFNRLDARIERGEAQIKNAYTARSSSEDKQ